MAKKGFFEKLGLIETSETQGLAPVELVDIPIPQVMINIDTETLNTENLVQIIYEVRGLADRTKSIFKIDEVSNALPKEMPNQIKKDSVLSTLGIFGINVAEIITDADARLNGLTEALATIIKKNNDVVIQAEVDIENLKKMIDDLNATIYKCKMDVDTSTNVINAEIKKVSDLKIFIGGIQ